MRIIIKIIAAPFVVVLTVLWAVLVFVFSWANVILNIASGIIGLLAIVLFVAGQTTNGIILAIVAFLLSPVGLPAIADWLVDRVGSANRALKNFITT